MDYNELKKSCKFFNGELNIPCHLHGDAAGFWLAESEAANAVLEGTADEFLSDYKEMGEPGAFSKVPPLILSILFAMFCKGADCSPFDCVEPFESLYLPRYIASTSMKI